MMNPLNETALEVHITEALRESDLYNERHASQFDIERLCDPEMLERFLRAQEDVWEKLAKRYGERCVTEEVIKVFNAYLDRGHSILTLLNKGLTIAGVRVKFVQFKPELTDTDSEPYRLYRANCFSVVRQLQYGTLGGDAGKEIDLCILVNGLPLLTCELKNEGTGQSYHNGIYQYRYDRSPANRVLRNCLVHFVVDNSYAFMTTELKGAETRFLPFNKESTNPLVEDDYPTSYIWREVWQADSLLDLIQHFIKRYKVAGGKYVTIFPRYHQMRAVRLLRRLVREEGPGHNYLIQHSAGSGKTKSMAWLAHQLANMTNADNTPIFDSIIMVTDRIVLNVNMAEEVVNFQTTAGTVKDIRRGSKKLAKAIDEGGRIIISTVQKFAFALQSLKREKSRKYAVIIDEAHTALGNESAKDIATALTTDKELSEMKDFDPSEYSSQMDALMAYTQLMRGQMHHISYFAFTATPKDKTFALYGKDGKEAHDLYSMKQAIDEKFILDVLLNYRSYTTMYGVTESGKVSEEDLLRQFDEDKAVGLILTSLGQDTYIMTRKASIMLDHFMQHTINKIGRRAKAMVVCDSRKAAVGYKKLIDRLIAKHYGGAIKTLVAFSGEVKDDNGVCYSEGNMNEGGVTDDAIRKAFEGDEYKILIVAEKFQTGFDQPLLHTMYVDRRLGGIQCIQTLSRLNRCYPGKEDTMILDFRNTAVQVQEAFQPYYTNISLDGEVDTQRIYTCKEDIDQYQIFNEEEVDRVVQLVIDNKVSSIPSILLNIVEERVKVLSTEDQDLFRKQVDRYVRQYGFTAQFFDFTDPELEKYYIFCKLLYKFLPYTKETLPMEILELVDLEKLRIQMSYDGVIELEDEEAEINSPRMGEPTVMVPDEQRSLKEILDMVNSPYADILNENDVVIRQIWQEVMEDPEVNDAFRADNTYDALMSLVKEKFDEKVADQIERYYDFAEVMEKEKGFSMVLMERFVDALSRQTRRQQDLVYNEELLKEKIVKVMEPEFAEMSKYMRPLYEVVEYLFFVLNAESIPKLDGINELVKDTLNQVYTAPSLRLVDKRRNFNQLITKYEAFLKKLYYLIHEEEIEGQYGTDSSLADALHAFGSLWGLRNNPSPEYKKFADYLSMVRQWRNDESHLAPSASENEVERATTILVAMYLYVTGWSITDLEEAGY
ncbi:type I restriction endonuclease subunit R [Porphyromonas sp. HMSC065F10]|uniref:type I restriction endonuclease subunit R n=1 Tax=Porphyromonas sp. HMSC065F10 TaxID=1739394 RepID=UPI0008A14668|nr:DEAD/DEAH box helicase family protein [Porphyromonas sp. HMSC065F10]OFR37121.1 hypothetical protein HMPREF2890_04075 [Porphyromonas sp. HMSC065F10]